MPAIISGTVFDDLNSNGTFDPGEPGIPNAFVVLEDTTGSCVSTQTDANGDYSFTNLTVAGTYTVYETVADPGATCPPTTFTQPTGFTGSTTPRQLSVTVTTADIANNVDLSGNDFGHDNPEIFGCQSFAWQVAGSPTGLNRINLATGDVVDEGNLIPSTQVNAIGYNPIDGNIWGYDITTEQVVRLDANRNLFEFDVANLPNGNFNIGDVDANGYLYLTSGSETRFYVVDVDPNRDTYLMLVDPATGFQPDTAPFGTATNPSGFADWAFNPNDGFLYGVNITNGSVTRFDPVTGARTALTTNPSPAASYGAVFFDSGNNLYAINNGTGAVGRYNIVGNTATRTAFSTAQPSSQNDGARCATAPVEFAAFDTNKTATPEVGVGDTITYTIVLDNIGTTTADSVTFVDTIPDGTTFVANSLTLDGGAIPGNPNPPGASLGNLSLGLHTVTFQVVVDTIPSPNPIPNVASGSFTSFDPFVGTTASGYNTNVASTTVNFAIIHSTKEVDLTNAAVGDTLTYTIVLRNTGNTTTTSITFIDTIPNGTTFVAGSLSQDGTPVAGSSNPPGVALPNDIGPGGVSTITFNVVVNSLPSPNPIPNDASTPFEYIGDPSVPTTKTGDSSTNTVNTLVNLADLDPVTKSVDKEFADVGDTITYTIVMTNNGNVTATNVVFIDTIPNDTTFITDSFTENATTIPGANPQSGVGLQDIAPGATTTLTFQVTVDTIPSPNPIPNFGEVSYTYTADPSVPDGESARDTTNRVFTEVNTADLELDKSIMPSNADIGDTLTFTIVLTNTGNTTATNVTFSDTIPNGTTYVANSFAENGVTIPGADPEAGVSLNDIPAGGVATVTFQAIVDTIPNPNPIENIAISDWNYTIDPSVPDGGSARGQSNTANAQINNADLDLVKSADITNAGVGDTITYTVVLTNTGNTTATNVTFSDTIPNGTSFVSNSFTENGVVIPGANPEAGVALTSIPGGGVTTVTFQVTVDTVPSPNPVQNIAVSNWNYTIDPSVPDGGSGSDSSNPIDTLINDANLDLVKSVDLEYADIGDTITYTIAITNIGNVTANNVVFTDTIPSDTTFVANSVTVDGVTQPGVNPQAGVNLSSIAPSGITTVTFQVTVDTVPSPNPIPNSGDAAWTFTSDPSVPDGESRRDTSNTVDTEVNNADLELVKTSSPSNADVGDTVTYTIVLTNTGNTTATNVTFSDTIPNDTTFIPNSFTENGAAIPGADPEVGVSLNDIPGGGVTTVTFQVTVDTIPSPNPIENIAVADWTYTIDPRVPNGGSGSEQSNQNDTQVNNASITSVKSTDKDFATIGDTITYTIVLTNTGNTTANNVVFTDTIPTDTTFVSNSVTLNGSVLAGVNPEVGVNVGSLAPGEVATITFQITIDTIPSPNPIENIGVTDYTYTVDPSVPNGATGSDPSNPVESQINAAIISPDDGGLVKSVNPEFADIGDTLTYTTVVENTGNVTANNVVFSDTIPNDTTFVTNSVTVDGVAQPGVNPESGINIGNIGPGEVATITFQVTVGTIPSPNPIPNQSKADYTFTVDPANPNSESRESLSNIPEAQVNTANISNEDGSLVKSVDPEFANIGDTLTYTIVLSNSGNTDANNVVFTDTIPTGTSFVTNSVTVDGITQPGVNPESGVNIGTISPNQIVTVTFQVVVDTIPSTNPIENEGKVAYDYTVDPSVPNGSSDESLTNTVDTTVNNADLSANKTTDPVFVDIGDTITYTVVISNSGNVTANNVVFTDTIPNDTTFVADSVMVDGVTQPGANPESGVAIGSIAPGGVSTVTFQVTVDTIPSPNPIINTANVDWTFTSNPNDPDGESGSTQSNPITNQTNNASIEVDKVTTDTVVDVGDTITYTIVARNTGNVPANNVVVTDTIPNDTTFVTDSVTVNGIAQAGVNPESGINVGSINPGEVVTITFEVTVDTIPSPNPIANIATSDWTYTVDPNNPDGESGSSTSQPAESDVVNATLEFDKVADPEFADVGETITYTILITNSGNTTATNVLVTDTIPNGTSFVGGSVNVNGLNIPGANPETGISVPDIGAGSTATVTFEVTVDTIPSPNPIANIADVSWNYTVDPSVPNGGSGSGSTPPAETEVNNGTITSEKSVDPEFAQMGDTLTYTIILTNIGNVPSNNVVFSDTIPNDTTFVPNSVTVGGGARPGENPEAGINIGTINPGDVVTVTFQVTVDTIPSPNPIVNIGVVDFTYTVDPSNPNGVTGSTPSNPSETQINDANISNEDGGLVKSVDLEFADVGDTLTYTIVLQNTGNVPANNVVLNDTIPNDTTFVTDSVTVNGVAQPGVNPETGVSIVTINPGEVVTVTFKVTVDTIPSPNPVPNFADVSYDFTVDPSLPDSESERNSSNTVDTQVNRADLSNNSGGIIKSADPEFADIGETITYTTVLNNKGNVDANNVVFTDTIPENTSFVPDSVTVNGAAQPGVNPEAGINIGTITPGEVVTITFQVTVDTIPSPNTIANTSNVDYTYTVDPADPDGVSANEDSNEVETDVNNATISNEDGGLVKSSDPEFADVGDTITYTIVLQNTGNVPANNVVLDDTIPNGTAFVTDSVTINGAGQPGANPETGINIGTINPNEVVTVMFQVTVESIPSPNPIPNSADVAYDYTVDPSVPNGESDRNTSNEVDTTVNNANISPDDGGLVKSVNPDFASVGDTITYTIVLQNTGNTTANNVVVSDTIPNDTTLVPNSVTIDGVTQPGLNPQTGINIGTVAPNEVITVTFQVTVDTVPSPNPIANSADVAYDYTVDPSVPNGESDRNTSNEVDTTVNNANISPDDGGLVKSVDPEFADVGDTLTYTIVLRNTGNTNANNVIVNDTIPNGTTFVPNSVTLNGATVGGADPESGISVGTIAPNQVVTITFQVIVDTIPSPNPVPNSADVSYTFTSDPNDPNGEERRNTSNEVDTQINRASISNEDGGLQKSVDPEFADVGDTLTYTIVLENTGNTPANNVVLNDTIPSGTTFVTDSVTVNGIAQPGDNPESGITIGTINPGQVITVTFQVIVDTIPTVNPVPNSADVAYDYTVDPSVPNGESDRNTSNEVDTQVNNANISPEDGGLVKSVDPEFATIGDTLTYTTVLRNTGNVPANNVVFSDTIPTGTTFITDSLSVNGVTQPGVNPEAGVNIGTINPGEVVTVMFQVLVETIPSPNSVENVSQVSYDYTVDPSVPNGSSETNESNEVDTEINNASISPDDGGLVKSADPEFADLGDTITFTIRLQNTGNVTANNVVFTDTIPENTTFVNDSVTVNGTTQPGVNPEAGVNIGSIAPSEVVTVTFQVVVTTLPNPNTVTNQGKVDYTFTADPNDPDGEVREELTNETDTEVNTAKITNRDGGFVKSADPEFAAVGDTITYTIVLQNTGNTTANNVIFTDTIPTDTSFVPNSVTVNGVTQPGVNPQNAVNIGSIGPNEIVTVTFQVIVDTIPSPNPIENQGKVTYTYTVDPSIPNGESDEELTNEAETTVNNANIDPFDKSVNPSNAAVGETLTYTIVLQNSGNVDANNVIVNDTIPEGTSFVADSVTLNGVPQAGSNPESGINVGTLNPGEVATITFQVIVESIPSVNPILNTAEVSYSFTSDPNDPDGEERTDLSNEAEAQINDADISNETGGLVKSVDPEFADVGDTLTYTIFLQNNGNVPANNVVFSDTIPTDTTFVTNSVSINGMNQPGADPEVGINVGTINPGQVVTIMFQVTVDTLPSPNPVENVGTVSYTFTGDPSIPNGQSRTNDTNTVDTQVNTAKISNEDGGLQKSTAPEFAQVGDTVTYTIVATNTGNVPANNVVISDTIPSGTTFVPDSVTINGSAQGGVNPQSGINVGTINPGQVVTVMFQVTIDTIPNPNPIENQAKASYSYTVDPADPDGVEREDLSNTTDNTVNDAMISNNKEVDKEFADIGDTLTYTITISNDGNATATNVVFTDTIPNDTTFVADSVTVNGSTQAGANPESGVNVGSIPPNSSAVVTFKVVVDTIPSPNPIANVANVSFTFTVDPSVPNGASDNVPSDPVETQVNTARISPDDGSFTKSVDPSFAAVGDTITYTIVASNTGNVAATNVVVQDTIPNGTTFIGASVTINGVVNAGANPQTGITLGTINPGEVITITFKVLVETIPSPNPIENSAVISYNYTVDPSVPNGASNMEETPDIPTQINEADISNENGGLIKSVDLEFADVGDTLTYTIFVQNNGNVNANNVVVTDTVPEGTSFVAGSVTINGVPDMNANPETGITIGTLPPNSPITITFQVLVETIPTVNPVPNDARVNYTFTVDPSIPNGRVEEEISNEVDSQINSAIITPDNGSFAKSVDKAFADIGDTLTYTITATNTGNVTANNVVITDTLPNDVTFVPGSVTINGASSNDNPETGINVGSIAPNATTIVTFKVTVDTIPSPNPIVNNADIAYDYTVDPNNPNGESNRETVEGGETEVRNADISTEGGGFEKLTEPSIVDIGDTVTYTIVLENTGNVPANNVVVTDPIPDGTSFVTNSVTVNGMVQGGVNPENGISIGTINAGEVVTVTFRVIIDEIPEENPIKNTATVAYEYTVDPNEPPVQNENESNETENQVNNANISTEDGGLQKLSEPSIVDIGDTVTFTILAKNTGNVTANNVVITDTIPAGTSFIENSVTLNGAAVPGANPESGITVGNISAGATATITFKVIVDEIPEVNPFENQAIVSYEYTVDPQNPPVQEENPSNTTENQVNHGDISVEGGGFNKSANIAFGDIGDTITYTIVARNTGNVPVNQVIVTDPIPDGTTFVQGSLNINGVPQAGANPATGIDIGTLNPNEGVTITFQVVIDEVPDTNPIENIATVNYEYTVDPENPPVEVENDSNPAETEVRNAEISPEDGGFTKSANLDFADLGDTITYTIVAKNTGNVPANNVIVSDTIPEGTSFIENSVTINNVSAPGLNPATGIVLGTVDPGKTVTITFKVLVETIPSPNPLSNEANVSYNYTVDPEQPPVTENNTTDPAETQVNHADLSGIEKTSNVEFAKIGDTITYTFAIPNSGNTTANNVILTDTIPEGTSFIENSVTVDGNPRPGESPVSGINVGSIAPNDSVTVTFSVKVEKIPERNPILNQGTVDYEYLVNPNNPPVSASDVSNENDVTIRDANISPDDGGFTKVADPQFAKLGETITYTITLTNTGNVPANNVVFSDTIPDSTMFVQGSVLVDNMSQPIANPELGINLGTINPNQSVIVQFKVIVTEIPDDEMIENFGRVSYQFILDPDDPPVVEEEETLPAIVTTRSVDFSGDNFTKSADPEFAALGDTITYSFFIRNNGNIDAENVIFTDTIPEGTELIPDSVFVNGTSVPNSNPQNGIELGTIDPGEVVTLSFQVVVTSIPNTNPIPNNGRLDYVSRVNPDADPVPDSAISNGEEVQVNSADIVLEKSSNVDGAVVGDTITYTVKVSNNGNVEARNVLVTDLLAPELAFIEGTVTVDGVTLPDGNPAFGIDLGTIGAGKMVVISYQATLLERPESGEVPNMASSSFEFTVDPNEPPRQGREDSNINIIKAEIAELTINKTADKTSVILNEVITYTVKIENTGTVKATKIIFRDDLDDGLEFIRGSFMVNGMTINGANIEKGVNIGSLEPGKSIEIKYQAKLVAVCCLGTVVNSATSQFNYRATANSPERTTTTNPSTVTIEAASPNFKQLNVNGTLRIPSWKPEIEYINDITTSIEIVDYYVIDTIKSQATSQQILTGYKLVVTAKIIQHVEYTAANPRQSIHSADFEKKMTLFIILPENYVKGTNIDIVPVVEDIHYEQLNGREVFTNLTAMVNAKVICARKK